MIGKGFFCRVIDAKAFVGGIVVAKHRVALPVVVTLYAEVIVALYSKTTCPGCTFEQTLSKRYGGRYAVLRLLADGDIFPALDIVGVALIGVLCLSADR